MGLDKVTEALDRFFLDIIGLILPGVTLIIGLWILLGTPQAIGQITLLPPDSVFEWVLLLTVSYTLGYVVLSVGETVVLPVIDRILSRVETIPVIRKVIPKTIVTEKKMYQDIQEDNLYKSFVSLLKEGKSASYLRDVPSNSIRTWRNIAISIVQEGSHTIYRFMFISLLNLGIATSLLIILAIIFIAEMLQNFFFYSLPINANLWIVVFATLSVPFLIERRYQFFVRAIKTPFSMAVTKLILDQEQDKAPPIQSVASALQGIGRPTVYLAGGFHSGWQDHVIASVNRFRIIDPRIHKLQDKHQYTLWDLEGVRSSDLVFAYLETSNPGGFALALEVGFAKALGKRVILVDEKSVANADVKKYMSMVHASADVVFATLAEGVDFLNRIENVF